MVSEEDDNFPVTPDSKRSGGKHNSTAGVSPHRESSQSGSKSEPRRRATSYHPYNHRPRRMSEDRQYDDRAEQILRRQSSNQYSEALNHEVGHTLNVYVLHIAFTSIGSGGVIEVDQENEHAHLPLRYSL
jgi:hypothetical protein